jgi:hypothetical protein
MCSTGKGSTSREEEAPGLWHTVNRGIAFLVGFALTLNFAVFWAGPIAGMGGLWKLGLRPLLMPFYRLMDESTLLRKFAEDYVYARKEYSDYFAISVLLIVNCFFTIGGIFYYQHHHGELPWKLIAAYYCSWVGVGGRIMGAAYTLAHREGHVFTGIYKKWLQPYVGNVFENGLGCFFGNVPTNFSTSHVYIHHRLDGGLGDSFYMWDLDRTSFVDFMVYQQRIFLHMIGYSSLKFFRANGQNKWVNKLQRGVYTYVGVGAAVWLITKSSSFVFWIYIQPLFCMTYFLALINVGFHGFIEYDDKGEAITWVNSTTIIDGADDYFGEDDHMAHHYAPQVFHRDLPEHQANNLAEYKKHRASVFRNLSIAELSIFLIFGMFDKLADHYVDYNEDMSREEIIDMLRTRATRKEISNAEYNRYLHNPTEEARKGLRVADPKSLSGQPYLTMRKQKSKGKKE